VDKWMKEIPLSIYDYVAIEFRVFISGD